MSSMFETALKNTLANETSYTENGAIGFKTAGNPLLDIHFAASSLRNKSKEEIEKMFQDAYYFDPIRTIQWLFMARDVRGGMGERRTFRICFSWLANVKPDVVKKLIPLVAEYGRWDDLLYSGLEGELWDVVVDYIDNQITEDYKNVEAGKPISLLAKWCPSINASSPKTVALAKKICKALDLSEKQYRKMLSTLRRHLNVIEVDMSAKQWSAIDYEKVPSLANLKYKNSFLRNDEKRRREYLEKLKSGEAKINSSVAFPCDIVHKYGGRYSYYGHTLSKDDTLEAMWKALPNYVADLDKGSTICVADSSGSMTVSVGNSQMTAMQVAYSLAIYFAEKLTGPFKDKTITFSHMPKYLDMSNASELYEKLNIMYGHSEVADTNIEGVFDLLLETAVQNKLEQKDIPSNVLIVSDMEFNAAQGVNHLSSNYNAKQTALFTRIAQKWEVAGYVMPRLVFWNVNSRTGTVPVQQNKNGVALVSGYSPAIAKMVFSAKLDPYEVLLETLDSERYAAVTQALNA